MNDEIDELLEEAEKHLEFARIISQKQTEDSLAAGTDFITSGCRLTCIKDALKNVKQARRYR